jgi:uncharacterized membrane protein YsdA (DUF1294 family)
MPTSTNHSSARQTFALVSIISILGIGLVVSWLTNWQPYWIWLVTTSIVTFLLYGFDKNQARLGRGRVPEIILHVLALLGGFMGGWLGRIVFHHKTHKSNFTIVLTISTILHLFIIYLVFIRT